MRSAAISSLVGAEQALLDSIIAGALLDADSVAARAFTNELTDMLLDDGGDLRGGRPLPDMLRGTLSSIAAVAHQRPWLAKAMLERVAAKQHLNAKEPLQLVSNYQPAGWLSEVSGLFSVTVVQAASGTPTATWKKITDDFVPEVTSPWLP